MCGLRFLTYNWNPVVFPVCRFGYNKIDSRTRLVDVSLTLNFKENVKMGTDIKCILVHLKTVSPRRCAHYDRTAEVL